MPSSLRKSRSPVIRSATTPGLRNRTYEPTAVPRGTGGDEYTAAAPRLARTAAAAVSEAAERHRGDPFKPVVLLAGQVEVERTDVLGQLDGRAYDMACGRIDIGHATTELTARMAPGVWRADGSVRPEPLMDVEEVARAVVYMAGLPLDVKVATMTVLATKMPFVGRG